MFLGVVPLVTNWNAAKDEFSLILDYNPLAEYVFLFKCSLFPNYCD